MTVSIQDAGLNGAFPAETLDSPAHEAGGWPLR